MNSNLNNARNNPLAVGMLLVLLSVTSNPVNLPNLLHTNVNSPSSQVTTSANHFRDHDQSINDLLNTTVNHSSSTRNHRRRRKRKTNRNRYWRRDNHNIQLDKNSFINLSSVTLTDDETQLLARSLSFCPTPRHINWTEVMADFV